ncbi:SDR family NAD(P)-dependent oxidoreductase [Tsukamurella tyrosinosolvens]|uniref:SDR family NAD(P)-dependent oxidoreductase n=1 Tax=Tsukamurella tyrosinosolvens TaxID=57704 RepID=UPI001AF5B36B|nr:SDR family NAD(P)-dependent oxidoreductase [Tsukamurella tyrosinosolvens]QRY85449.1 SDR family NAD(P)-dependent oxidoreductase [Tsukamurella tyrosinosolvens]
MATPSLLGRLSSPRRETDPHRLAEAVGGRTVLVTGASFGLGAATAELFAAAGATVLLVARTADKLDEVAARIRDHGGAAHVLPADLTDPRAVEDLAAAILHRHGAPDILINNAGKSIRRSLTLQLDRPQDFERTVDINYLGPVRLLLHLVPAMTDAGGGRIVNISTVGVRMHPGPRWGAYQASKGAFDTWFRSVTPELRARNIRVTSIYMALIHTRMSAPTPSMRRLPGLDPEHAAQIVAAAVVDGPRSLAPWWSWPLDVASTVAGGAFSAAYTLAFRFGEDSPSARANAGVLR